MPILLLRHAQAVDPRRWDGPDRVRPLTAAGEQSAVALASLWRTQAVERVLSSPYPRCVATVAPMAAGRGLHVESTEELAEGSARAALSLLQRAADQFVVACTHGDVIPAILEALERQGVVIARPWRWDNASTWRLETEGSWVVGATYVAPPPVTGE